VKTQIAPRVAEEKSKLPDWSLDESVAPEGEHTASGPDARADGTAAAGVVFFSYHPKFASIEIAAASETPRWLTRALVRQIMGYPFDQLGCLRVSAVTPRRAMPARRFLESFGFKREGLARRGSRWVGGGVRCPKAWI